MNSGTVNLIATDPPFNKNKDFHATPDSLASGARFIDRWAWNRDVHEEWVDAIKDDWPGVWQAIENSRVNHSEGMAAFLCWLGIRLIEMKRVLADDGSIYLHIDHTAHAYAKALMDAIFGQRYFKNEIVWKRTSSHNRAKRWGPIHDTLLFYTVSQKYTWHRNIQPLEKDYVDKFYHLKDKNGRYRLGDLTGPGLRNGDTGQPWRGTNPSDRGRHWEVPPDRALPKWFEFPNGYERLTARERLDVLDDQGLIAWPHIEGGVPQFRRYLGENSGVPYQDMILDIKPISSRSLESTRFPTQKPLALYERIITASSNEGDMVLDPFCGCATTPIAAERLGRQWVGMDIWNGAHDQVIKRMQANRQLLTESDPQIHYEDSTPSRTDDNDSPFAVPDLRLRLQRVPERWERLTHAQMVSILAQAQANGGKVVCAGCGIQLPGRYLQLDHQLPRKDGGENVITNRILLCGPCNNAKRATLTLTGLLDRNRREGDMENRELAVLAATRARDAAQRCRDEMR